MVKSKTFPDEYLAATNFSGTAAAGSSLIENP